MHIRKFLTAFSDARRRIQREGVAAVAPVERKLRELLPELDSDEDRRVAENMLKRLPGYAEPPEPPSEFMLAAKAVENEAYAATGTDEERIAVMAEARRRIFEIADQAPADEAPGIRGMTRVLEHLEENLRDPYWPFDGPRDNSDSR